MEDDSTNYDSPYNWTQANIPIEDVSQALVSADNLWNAGYDANSLPFEEHFIPAAAMDIATYSELHQHTQISQILSSTVQHNVFECNQLCAETSKPIGNSAFVRYKRGCSSAVPSTEMKQKSLKKCFDFLRRMYRGGTKSRASWDEFAPTHVNAGKSIEESLAFTHRMAERNRRDQINQQFLALHSILPRNSKKDKQSVLSEAILQLNHLKLRKRELELRNQALMETLSSNITNDYSNSQYGEGNICGAEASGTDVLMRYIADEAVVVIEESNIPDEAIMQVTLKKIVYSYMDIVISLLKCLRELKLEVLRIECGNMDSMQPVIQLTIRTRTKEEGWQIPERKNIEGALKRALTGL